MSSTADVAFWRLREASHICSWKKKKERTAATQWRKVYPAGSPRVTTGSNSACSCQYSLLQLNQEIQFNSACSYLPHKASEPFQSDFFLIVIFFFFFPLEELLGLNNVGLFICLLPAESNFMSLIKQPPQSKLENHTLKGAAPTHRHWWGRTGECRCLGPLHIPREHFPTGKRSCSAVLT